MSAQLQNRCPACGTELQIVVPERLPAKPKRDSLIDLKEELIFKTLENRVGWVTTSDVVMGADWPQFPVSDVLWRLQRRGLVKHSRTSKGKDLWMLKREKS